MDKRILIQWPSGNIIASLQLTATTETLLAVLPIESVAQTWGDEVYFSTPVSNQILEDDAKAVVDLGELAYWVEGDCIAIGFGPTPISQGDEIRLAACTNIWADTDYELTALKNVRSGELISVVAA